MAAADAHAARVARLRAAVAAAGADAPLGLAKRTSNLFRDRAEGRKQRLDLGEFRHVLRIDTGGWVDVEGLCTYEALADATLAVGQMPAVVPQLKTITIGGAAAGVGIEATSFREGLVHDTLLEIEVLLPGGDVVVATPDNEHRALFYGFANSYGTLGYALRLKARTRPVKRFVRVEHRPFADAGAFFAALDAACADPASDFVDGVVFGRGDHVLSVAAFVDDAPRVSDYTFERIYYRSLKTTPVDFLTTRDYLWRWDTDWFWCSKNVGAQHPLVRRLLGRSRLNSRTYTKIMRLNSRWGFTRAWARLRGIHTESVIQDVDIPLPRAAEFLDFLLAEIGIVPVWVCPIRPAEAGHVFTLYPLEPGVRYVNFGFWDVVPSRQAHAPGHFNRLVERKVIELGGIKSLYSESFFTHDEFDRAYAMERYRVLKATYDPQHRALDLYDKVVGRR